VPIDGRAALDRARRTTGIVTLRTLAITGFAAGSDNAAARRAHHPGAIAAPAVPAGSATTTPAGAKVVPTEDRTMPVAGGRRASPRHAFTIDRTSGKG